MLIPYGTDAPIYHGPWATIGFIVANVLAFLFMVVGTVDPEPLALEYGTLNPIQWLTSNFLHADLWHLVGNMVFLWAFGLVVEGKIGWGRFTAVYLGLGITQAGIEQICSLGLGQEGGSFGASAIVFGLMGMALVWAPSNEMQCLLLVRLRPIHFDISILVMSLLYVAVEFVLA
ncbi:MAG: rhomboid family intramembrane serine protease, partial [Pirellulales bacterium]